MLAMIALAPGLAVAATDPSAPVLAESFESSPGLPTGWRFVTYTPDVSTASVVSGGGADGAAFLRIESSRPNHARVIFPVAVTPGGTYEIKAMLRCRGARPDAAAAAIGLDNQTTVSVPVRTDDQWQAASLFVAVGGQTSIDVTLGLGNFGSLNQGSADFDSVVVAPAASVPSGMPVVALTGGPAQGAVAVVTPGPSTAAAVHFVQGPNRVLWVFVGLLAALVVGLAAYLLLRPAAPAPDPAVTDPPAPAGTDPPAPAAPVRAARHRAGVSADDD